MPEEPTDGAATEIVILTVLTLSSPMMPNG